MKHHRGGQTISLLRSLQAPPKTIPSIATAYSPHLHGGEQADGWQAQIPNCFPIGKAWIIAIQLIAKDHVVSHMTRIGTTDLLFSSSLPMPRTTPRQQHSTLVWSSIAQLCGSHSQQAVVHQGSGPHPDHEYH